MKYVCLLRGINVGGKNTVSMGDLREWFEAEDGFRDVSTYINSGNVLFQSADTDIGGLITRIEAGLRARFELPLSVTVVSHDQLAENIKNAPKGWGTDESRRHNLVFVRPPRTAKEVLAAIGTLKPELEMATAGDQVVYWSLSMESPGRTNASKFIAHPFYKDVTIRNYNTSRKLLTMLDGAIMKG